PLPLRVRRVRLVETHGVHLSPWIQGRREKFFRGTAASSPKARPTHAEARETGETGGSPPKNLLILRVATRGANSRLSAIAQGARVTGSIISPGLERRCPLPRSRPPAWARGPPAPLPSIPPTAKEFPMRRVAFPSPPISLSRSRLNLLVWTAVALGLAVSSAFADTIILKNGNKIHGRTTIENGIVRVDFGEQGRMSMPASEVRQIIEDDSNAFADTGEAAIVPAAAGGLTVVRLKEGADRIGRCVYLGWSVAGTDDRVLRLSLPEGGTMEILRSSIASIEPVEEASQHSDLTHLVTPFIDRGGDRSVAGEAAGG